MQDYDHPTIPPGTPPVIQPDADADEASELVRDDGDSDYPGQVPAETPAPDQGDRVEPAAPDEVQPDQGDTINPPSPLETPLPPD